MHDESLYFVVVHPGHVQGELCAQLPPPDQSVELLVKPLEPIIFGEHLPLHPVEVAHYAVELEVVEWASLAALVHFLQSANQQFLGVFRVGASDDVHESA